MRACCARRPCRASSASCAGSCATGNPLPRPRPDEATGPAIGKPAAMKAVPILVAIAGVAAMAALVGYFGAGAVMRSLLAVGGVGFAAVCAIHLALIAVMGLAWRALLPGAPSGKVMWARLVRDSGSEALPLSQVGGYVLGARSEERRVGKECRS